ncbi:MAG: branched-chain amino acid transporter permease [Lachnospiraceae bacterium]
MSNQQGILLIAVISSITILLRFLPFWIFGGDKDTTGTITYLGKVLPYAIMGMLVIYCLRDISFLQAPYGLPRLLAVAFVAGLHGWKRNTLMSILGGTVFYMFLIQVIF